MPKLNVYTWAVTDEQGIERSVMIIAPDMFIAWAFLEQAKNRNEVHLTDAELAQVLGIPPDASEAANGFIGVS